MSDNYAWYVYTDEHLYCADTQRQYLCCDEENSFYWSSDITHICLFSTFDLAKKHMITGSVTGVISLDIRNK